MFRSSSKRLSSPQFHSPVAVPPAAVLVVSAGADPSVLGAVDALAEVVGEVDPTALDEELAAWLAAGAPHAANNSTPTSKIPNLCFIFISLRIED
jgi:hypothetical protein